MYKTLMFKVFQQTISNPVSVEGIGLHTGKKSKITLLPAKENQGIIFKRVDLKKIILYSLITKMFQTHNFVLV